MPDLSSRCLHSCLPAVLFVAIPDDWCHAGFWHLVHEAARWQTVIVSCFARYDSMNFLCKETLFDGELVHACNVHEFALHLCVALLLFLCHLGPLISAPTVSSVFFLQVVDMSFGRDTRSPCGSATATTNRNPILRHGTQATDESTGPVYGCADASPTDS